MGLRGRGTGWGLRGRGCWAGGGGGWCLGPHAPAAHTAPPSPSPPRTLPRRCVAATVCKLSSARRVPCLAWNPTVSQRALARRRPLRHRACRQHQPRPVEEASATGGTPPHGSDGREGRRRAMAAGAGRRGRGGSSSHAGVEGGGNDGHTRDGDTHTAVQEGASEGRGCTGSRRHRWTRGGSLGVPKPVRLGRQRNTSASNIPPPPPMRGRLTKPSSPTEASCRSHRPSKPGMWTRPGGPRSTARTTPQPPPTASAGSTMWAGGCALPGGLGSSRGPLGIGRAPLWVSRSWWGGAGRKPRSAKVARPPPPHCDGQ